MPFNWQFIPQPVLDEIDKVKKSEQWAENELKKTADQWAKSAGEWVNQQAQQSSQDYYKQAETNRQTLNQLTAPVGKVLEPLSNIAMEGLGRIAAIPAGQFQAAEWRRYNEAQDPNSAQAKIDRLTMAKPRQEPLAPEVSSVEALTGAVGGDPRISRSFNEVYDLDKLTGGNETAKAIAGGLGGVEDVAFNPLTLTGMGSTGKLAGTLEAANAPKAAVTAARVAGRVNSPEMMGVLGAAGGVPKLSSETDQQYQTRQGIINAVGLAGMPAGVIEGTLGRGLSKMNFIPVKSVEEAANKVGFTVAPINQFGTEPHFVLADGRGIWPADLNMPHLKIVQAIGREMGENFTSVEDFLRKTNSVRTRPVESHSRIVMNGPESAKEAFEQFPKGQQDSLATLQDRFVKPNMTDEQMMNVVTDDPAGWGDEGRAYYEKYGNPPEPKPIIPEYTDSEAVTFFKQSQPPISPEEWITEAKKRFDSSKTPSDGSFLTPDGTFITGFQTHEAIGSVFGADESRVWAMRFITDTGSIRLAEFPDGGLWAEMSAKPTPQQLKGLMKMARDNDYNVTLDLIDPATGKNVHSYSVEWGDAKKVKELFDQLPDKPSIPPMAGGAPAEHPWITNARKVAGETDDIGKAKFIAPDGTLLGGRQDMHDDIFAAMGGEDYENRAEVFGNETGAVRIWAGEFAPEGAYGQGRGVSVEIGRKLTPEQRRVIVENATGKRFDIDVRKPDGTTDRLGSYTVPAERSTPANILAAINSAEAQLTDEMLSKINVNKQEHISPWEREPVFFEEEPTLENKLKAHERAVEMLQDILKRHETAPWPNDAELMPMWQRGLKWNQDRADYYRARINATSATSADSSRIRGKLYRHEGGQVNAAFGAVPAAATALVPQQEGESDEMYTARLIAAGAFAAGAVGVGLRGLKRPAPPRSISPIVDRLKFEEPTPAPTARPYEPLGLEKVRRDQVRAWSDRGIDAKILEQDVAKNSGALSMEEQLAELWRLDPQKAAEVNVQAIVPAVRAVEKIKGGRDLLSKWMVLQHNVDVAHSIGQRVESWRLHKGDAPDVAEAKGRIASQMRKFSGGLTLDESVQGFNDLVAALSPAERTAMQEAAETVYTFNKALLKRKLDSGMITPELYNWLNTNYPHYNPTVILKYLDEEGARLGRGQSVGISTNTLRRLTVEGTEKLREDPLISTVRNAYQTEIAVRKNDAFNAFHKLVQRDAALASVVKEVPVGVAHDTDLKAITGFVNGKKIEYVVPDYLRNAVEQATLSPVPVVDAITGVWRALLTSRNPAFLSANALVDAGTYMLREMTRGGGPQSGGQAIVELAKAYFGRDGVFPGLLSGEYKGNLAEYLKAGGGMGGYTNITPKSGEELLSRMSKSNVLEIRDTTDLKRMIKDILTLKPVEAVSERIELAPRVASYKLAQKRGMNPLNATMAGRSVTIDFAQGGYIAKWLNRFVPFFNVGIQGGATLVRSYRENPRGFILTALTALVAPTIGAELWNRATPERSKAYDDVPQYLKDQGLVLMLDAGPTDSSGNTHPQFIHIRAREFAPIVVLAREGFQRAYQAAPDEWLKMAGLDPKMEDTAFDRPANEVAGGLAQSVSPFSSGDLGGAFAQMLPPGVSTGIELFADKDFFRGSKIATKRGDQYANPAFREVGRLTGARPSQLQWAWNDLTGGPGQMLSDVDRSMGGEPLRGQAGAAGVPVAGSFLKRFVRGDIGGRLNEAQQNILEPDVATELRNQGINYTPGVVESTIRDIPLQVQEQGNYQQLANQYVNQMLRQLLSSAQFQSLGPDQKQDVITSIVASAHERAAGETLRGIGQGEAVRRLQGVR